MTFTGNGASLKNQKIPIELIPPLPIDYFSGGIVIPGLTTSTFQIVLWADSVIKRVVLLGPPKPTLVVNTPPGSGIAISSIIWPF